LEPFTAPAKVGNLVCQLISISKMSGMSRRGFLGGAAACLASRAIALGGGVAIDPYAIINGDPGGFNNPSGKTEVSGAPVGGESTEVILWFGQSKPDNTVMSDNYSTVNAKNHNLNIFDGACYQASGGLLGNSIGPDSALFGQSYITRFNDGVITAAIRTRVIAVPIAVASTSITQWATGGIYSGRYGLVARRLFDLGLMLNKICLDIGETDAINGMTATTFTSNVNTVRLLLNAATLTAPLYIARTAVHPSASAANQTAIRNGQNNAINGTTILAGPDLDLIRSRDASGVHFNPTGSAAAASAWRTSLRL
jgi:hypothetical protein